MIRFLNSILENFRQALHALVSNKLRSFLSLLGISIGIFCIIGVQSAVKSLEGEVRGSIEELGDNTLYVQTMPWNEDPGQNYWKYFKRPTPSYQNFEDVKNKIKNAKAVSYHVYLGNKTIKYRNNSVSGVSVDAASIEYRDMFSLEFAKGRWFNQSEYHYGANKAIIGHKVAEELFGAIEPVGKEIKIMGLKVEIIGVLREEGESMISINNFDEAVVVSYEMAKKVQNVKSKYSMGNLLAVKGKDGIPLAQLKDELTGILRLSRKLRPTEENNFALNNISMMASALESIFGSLNIAAWFIGGFAILVGMFSVANIMFVSVKERTSLIGVKKALGAKKHIILMEFLIEAVALCILGGLLGLFLVFLILKLLSASMPFPMTLDTGNIAFGIGLSIVIGIISGLIPAYQAANMDPVEAMRA